MFDLDPNHYGSRTLQGRCRLPNGHFELTFGEGVPTGTMRLDLWNAEVRGRIALGAKQWQWRCFTHAEEDVIVLEVTGAGVPALSWHPDTAVSTRTRNRPDDLKPYPPQVVREIGQVPVSVQAMPEDPAYDTEGQGAAQYATAWIRTVQGDCTTYVFTTRQTIPGTEAAQHAVETVRRAVHEGIPALVCSHRAWWHAYYPRSFVSVPDKAIESFYWIQMYKMACASRKHGPLMDLMGPWFMPSNWPAYWWNLNMQLQYWPFYMSNHLDEAEPLPDTLWANRRHLAENADSDGEDAYAIGTVADPQCRSGVGAAIGNLPWAMHNLWLHYRSSMDDDFLREKVFPLMKGSFHYLFRILVEQEDGTWAMPPSASPEYTPSVESCTYTLACTRWLASTLIEADERLQARDPVVNRCRDVLDRLEPYPVDSKTGWMVGRNMPFTQSHRHWSHLFPIYPFHEFTHDQAEHVDLIEKSIVHWTDKPEAFAGYSWIAAASMHAAAGRGDTALAYLKTFLATSPLPNTLYREGNPVIETPLQFARALQEMLLTSHRNVICVFPGVPSVWRDIVFLDMLAEGAFRVSARRENGSTRWVRLVSLAGEPCRIRSGLAGSIRVRAPASVKAETLPEGVTVLTGLGKGDTAMLYVGPEPTELNGRAVSGPEHATSWGLCNPLVGGGG